MRILLLSSAGTAPLPGGRQTNLNLNNYTL